jgi:hypothetical protein
VVIVFLILSELIFIPALRRGVGGFFGDWAERKLGTRLQDVFFGYGFEVRPWRA